MESRVQEKTIFLSLPYWRSVVNILHTEIFNKLKQEGFRIVILSPFSKSRGFIKEFSGKNVFFEYLDTDKINQKPNYLFKAVKLIHIFRDNLLLYTFKEFLRRAGTLLTDFENLHASSHTCKFFKIPFLLFGRVFILFISIIIGLPFLLILWLGIADRKSLLDIYYKCYFTLAFFLKYRKKIDGIFKKYNPQLVCLSRMVNSPAESSIIKICKHRKIPTMGIFIHLDGLTYTTRNPFSKVGGVDRFLIWSSTLKKDVAFAYGAINDRIMVTGCPVHDFYFKFKNQAPAKIRGEFLRSKGLDPQKKIILAAFPCTEMLEKEDSGFLYWRAICESILESLLKGSFCLPAQLFIRVHPSASIESYNFLKTYFENKFRDNRDIFYIESAGRFFDKDTLHTDNSSMGDEEFRNLAKTLISSNVAIVGCSGFPIDAAFWDIPIISAVKPYEIESKLDRAREHLDIFQKYILKSGGVKYFDKIGDIADLINQYLVNQKLDSDGRRRIVSQLCGEVDGNACSRVSEAIRSMMN